LADPEKFDGRLISVRGFYHAEFESSGLYTSRDDARHFITESAIWIGAAAKGLGTNRISRVNDTYVLAEGIFHSTPKGGGTGAFVGELKDVTLFVTVPEVKLHEESRSAQ